MEIFIGIIGFFIIGLVLEEMKYPDYGIHTSKILLNNHDDEDF